jgi:hypothetical protein
MAQTTTRWFRQSLIGNLAKIVARVVFFHLPETVLPGRIFPWKNQFCSTDQQKLANPV